MLVGPTGNYLMRPYVKTALILLYQDIGGWVISIVMLTPVNLSFLFLLENIYLLNLYCLTGWKYFRIWLLKIYPYLIFLMIFDVLLCQTRKIVSCGLDLHHWSPFNRRHIMSVLIFTYLAVSVVIVWLQFPSFVMCGQDFGLPLLVYEFDTIHRPL